MCNNSWPQNYQKKVEVFMALLPLLNNLGLSIFFSLFGCQLLYVHGITKRCTVNLTTIYGVENKMI